MDLNYTSNQHAENLLQFQYYSWGVGGTIIATSGLIGNILAMIVLCNRRVQSHTSTFLFNLSIYDCLVLVSLLVNMSFPVIHLKTNSLQWYHDLYQYLHPYAYPIALTAQTGSIYTTVGFTVERYIAVCHPLKASSWCTITRTRKSILTILVASIIFNLPRAFEIKTVTEFDSSNNQTHTFSTYTDFHTNQLFRTIYLTYLHAFVMLLFPFAVLAVLNILLIRAVKKSSNSVQGSVNHSNQNRENNLTVMLIAVVVVFLVCQMPSIVDNIIAVTVDKETLASPPLVKLTVFSSLCVVTNSATNFYLYCLFGQKFRRVFCMVFCSLCREVMPRHGGRVEAIALRNITSASDNNKQRPTSDYTSLTNQTHSSVVTRQDLTCTDVNHQQDGAECRHSNQPLLQVNHNNLQE